MISKFLLSSALVVVGASAGMAQGFSGGELGLEYQSFNDLDTSTTTYFGGVEFEATPQIAFAVDFSFFSAEDSDENPTNATIHGLYKIPGGGSLGAFYGQDALSDGDAIDVFGAEGAYDFGLGQIEAFYGVADTEGDTELSFLGAAVDYDLGNGLGFIASFDALNADSDGDETTTTLFEIGGTYTISNGPLVFAKIGSVGLEVDDGTTTATGDDTYVSIGASIGFGANNGLTFNPRGIFSTSTLTF